MKTSKKLKARKMWANYYAQGQSMSIHGSKKLAQNLMEFEPTHQAVPVAVIPLNDVDSLVRKATDAYFSSLERNTENRWRDALTAIGVLPRQRKGGRK